MITVHRDKPNKDFLQIKNTHWMEFNKKYEPYALQLYLYLAKNADGYSFALSQKAAEEEAGIKKTSFHKYIDLLIQEGYLVRRSGNTYDFYETPHKQQKNEMERPPCGGLSCPQGEQQNLSHELRSSPQLAEFPQQNKEIYNRYTNNIDSGKDNQQQEEGNDTGSTKKVFIF